MTQPITTAELGRRLFDDDTVDATSIKAVMDYLDFLASEIEKPEVSPGDDNVPHPLALALRSVWVDLEEILENWQ